MVVCGCRRALAAGVKPGMTLTQARALLPLGAVHAQAYDGEHDAAALNALAQWATKFSPIVAPDDPAPGRSDRPGMGAGLLLDVTGCHRVFGGYRRLMHRLVTAVRRLGLAARVAGAPTFGAAWALARYGEEDGMLVNREEVREVLAPLPAAGLRLERDMCEALEEVGVTCIGHLLDLPRRHLPSRFGDDLLFRVDQALGQAIETIDPVRPRPPLKVERCFDGPVKDLEAIQLTVRGLIDQLIEHLKQREAGVRQMVLTLDRSDCPPVQAEVTTSRPNRTARHLWSLLGPKVEKLNFGFGVEKVTLHAVRAGGLPHEQTRAQGWRTEAQSLAAFEKHLGELLDTLKNRLGDRSVMQVEPVATRVAERATKRRSDGATKGKRKGTKVRPRTRHGGTKRRGFGCSPALLSPALLSRPQGAGHEGVPPDKARRHEAAGHIPPVCRGHRGMTQMANRPPALRSPGGPSG